MDRKRDGEHDEGHPEVVCKTVKLDSLDGNNNSESTPSSSDESESNHSSSSHSGFVTVEDIGTISDDESSHSKKRQPDTAPDNEILTSAGIASDETDDRIPSGDQTGRTTSSLNSSSADNATESEEEAEPLTEYDWNLLNRAVHEAQSTRVDYRTILNNMSLESEEAKRAILKNNFRKEYIALLMDDPYEFAFCRDTERVLIGLDPVVTDYVTAFTVHDDFLIMAENTSTLKKSVRVFRIVSTNQLEELNSITLPRRSKEYLLNVDSVVIALRAFPCLNSVVACIKTDGIQNPYRVDVIDLDLMAVHKSILLSGHGVAPEQEIMSITVDNIQRSIVTVDRDLRVTCYHSSGVIECQVLLPPPFTVHELHSTGVLRLRDGNDFQLRFLAIQTQHQVDSVEVKTRLGVVTKAWTSQVCQVEGPTRILDAKLALIDTVMEEEKFILFLSGGRGSLFLREDRHLRFDSPLCTNLFRAIESQEIVTTHAAFDKNRNQYLAAGEDGLYVCKTYID